MYREFNGDFDIRFDETNNIYHICANGTILANSEHTTHNKDCKNIDIEDFEICEDFLLSEYNEDIQKLKDNLIDIAMLYSYAHSKDKNEPKMCISCLMNLIRL